MSEFLSRTRAVRLGEVVQLANAVEGLGNEAEVLGLWGTVVLARYVDSDVCFILTDATYVS